MEQNNNYYTTNETYQQPTYQQGYQQTYQQPVQQPVPQPKKKSRFGTVLALVAVVAIVGGSAGFGGAYLAANTVKADKGETPVVSAETSDNTDNSKQPSPNGDVSSALSAISASNNGNKTLENGLAATTASGEYTAAGLYEAVNDAIVLIKVYKEPSASSTYDIYDYYFFGYGDKDKDKNNEPVYSGYGSGIVFTEDGYILTNAHVANDAARLEVVVNDYDDPNETHSYDAELIGADNSTDIAVIKIERDEPFKTAKLGDSDNLKVGQQVCAIGNPGLTDKIMFDHTMTSGIVSGLNRVCLADDGYSISLIQTDAAINSGNSGGGLFDMYGNVVGVVNSKIVATTYEGLGFALTINEAKPIMEDLLNYGYVKSRPVIGITTVELNEYRAQLYGAKLTKGLLVASINKGAPVEKSDLRVSDIITKVNGQSVEQLTDVQAIISKFKVGDTVTLTVARANDSGKLDSLDIDIILTEKSE